MLERNFCFEELMPLFRERIAAGESIRISPRGTSMMPMLRQGIDSVILAAPTGKLKKYDLPTKTQLSASEIAGAAMGDKKRKGNTVTLVIPRGKLGSVLVPTSTSELEGIVEAALRKDTK